MLLCKIFALGVVLMCFLNTQRLQNVVFNNCVSKKVCLKQFPLSVIDLFLETEDTVQWHTCMKT